MFDKLVGKEIELRECKKFEELSPEICVMFKTKSVRMENRDKSNFVRCGKPIFMYTCQMRVGEFDICFANLPK